jgi:hypothetical protein
MNPLTIKLDPLTLSDEQFYQLCQNNRDLTSVRVKQQGGKPIQDKAVVF